MAAGWPCLSTSGSMSCWRTGVSRHRDERRVALYVVSEYAMAVRAKMASRSSPRLTSANSSTAAIDGHMPALGNPCVAGHLLRSPVIVRGKALIGSGAVAVSGSDPGASATESLHLRPPSGPARNRVLGPRTRGDRNNYFRPKAVRRQLCQPERRRCPAFRSSAEAGHGQETATARRLDHLQDRRQSRPAGHRRGRRRCRCDRKGRGGIQVPANRLMADRR
jgi:hypothetical protein